MYVAPLRRHNNNNNNKLQQQQQRECVDEHGQSVRIVHRSLVRSPVPPAFHSRRHARRPSSPSRRTLPLSVSPVHFIFYRNNIINTTNILFRPPVILLLCTAVYSHRTSFSVKLYYIGIIFEIIYCAR